MLNHIDVLLNEVAQVEGVRVVNHVLVEHRVWIAQNKCRQLLEVVFSLRIILVKLLACGWEEHGIDLCVTLALDPDMLTVKCLCEDFAHLLVLSKERGKATSTR